MPVGDWLGAAIAAGVPQHILTLLAWVKLVAETLQPVALTCAGALAALVCIKHLVER